MMFPGTFLIKGAAMGTTRTAPFPRRGLAALFTAEVTQVAGSPTLSLIIEDKNHEDTTWNPAGSFSNITTEGVYTTDITPIKQQVRIAAQLSGGSQGDFVVVVIEQRGISWRL